MTLTKLIMIGWALSLFATACGSDGGDAIGVSGSSGSDTDSGGAAQAGSGGTGDSGGASGSGGGGAASSSGASGGGSGGTAGSPNVQDLTPEERGALCDWKTEQLGGYGTTIECEGDMTIVTNPRDQAECLAITFRNTCNFTVEQFEACVGAMAPSSGCVLPYDVCAPVVSC
jgi:hypothetical protein